MLFAGTGVVLDGPFILFFEGPALPSAGHFWPQLPANFSLSCLRRPYFFRQRKGMFRALGHGSLLAAAPKVTKNAA